MGSIPLITAYLLLAFGTFISFLNFYLSFLRFPVHRLSGGTEQDFRFVSGFPFVGSLSLWFAAFLLQAEPVWIWTSIAISLLDTGGPLWLALTFTWYTLRSLFATDK